MSAGQLSVPGKKRKRNDGQHARRASNQHAGTSQQAAHANANVAAVAEPSEGRQHAEARPHLSSHVSLEEQDNVAARPKRQRNKFKLRVDPAAAQPSELVAFPAPPPAVVQAGSVVIAAQLSLTAEHAKASGPAANRKRNRRRKQAANESNGAAPAPEADAVEAKGAPALQQPLPTTTVAPLKGIFLLA